MQQFTLIYFKKVKNWFSKYILRTLNILYDTVRHNINLKYEIFLTAELYIRKLLYPT